MKKILLICLLLGSLTSHAQYHTFKKATLSSVMTWECHVKKKGGSKSQRYRIELITSIPKDHHMYTLYQPSGAEAWPIQINTNASLQEIVLRTPKVGNYYMDTAFYTSMSKIAEFHHPRERAKRARWIKTNDSAAVSQNGVRMYKRVKYIIDFRVKKKSKVIAYDSYEKNREMDVVVDCDIKYVLCDKYKQVEKQSVNFNFVADEIFVKFKHEKAKKKVDK